MANALALLLVATQVAASDDRPAACGGLLLARDADGAVTAGSADAVRAAFAAGLPLRLGWSLDFDGDGSADVAHWSPAGFLTEFEGQLFAQVPDIQRQIPRRGEGAVALPPGAQRWSGLIGTDGTLVSHFADGGDARSLPVASTWCVDAAACAPEWRLVYQNDADGAPVAGSKRALFDALRRGQPLRLAWGFSVERSGATLSVEHAADPVFVTLAGDELFAQLPEHVGQATYHDPEQMAFGDPPSVVWRGLLGTTGVFDAVWVDRSSGAEVRRLPQRARVAWFALAPPEACQPAPVELAVPGGVRRDPRPRP